MARIGLAAAAPAPVAAKTVTVKGTGTQTTAAFSVSVHQLLVAFVSSGGGTSSNRQTVTVSGAGLGWSLVQRSDGQAGDAEIWTATASAASSGVKVTSAQSIGGGLPQSLTVVVFNGAQGVGASVAVSSTNSSTGAPSASFTSTVANSLVYGVGFDPAGATNRTFITGQAKVTEWADTAASVTAWVQRRTSAIAKAGTGVTIGDTAPAKDAWNLAAAEITPPGPPGAPVNVNAVDGPPGTVYVTWNPPSSGGSSPVTSYTVTTTPGNTKRTVGGSASSATISGLDPGTTYTFTVYATNAAGHGPPSPSTAPVLDSVPPSAPQNVTLTPQFQAAVLTWSAPASDGGSAVSSYIIDLDDPDGTQQQQVVSSSTSQFTFNSLKTGTTYFVFMYAVNEAGVSAAGESGNAALQGRTGNSGSVVGMAATADGQGYYLVTSAGYVYTFGDAQYYGSMGGQSLNKPVVGIAVDKATGGYWLVAADGGVFAFNAPFDGSAQGSNLAAPIVGMAATPDDGGYWLVGSDGGLFNYGDAQFEGNCYTIGGCGTPIVGVAGYSATGYWFAGQNGGVFSFNAPFYGSEGGKVNNLVGITATADVGGYWLVGSDGGVFNFGDAQFHGSEGGQPLNAPITALAGSGESGYWLDGSDGGVFSFNAPYLGNALNPESPPPPPPVGESGVGVYGGYGTQRLAAAAISEGWPVVGDAGALGIPGSPYTRELSSTPDRNVAQAIAASGKGVTWLSFWTVSGPAAGDSWYNAGFAAGTTAATTLGGYSPKPGFVVLDAEGYNGTPGNSAEWSQFLTGWSNGILSVNNSLTPAFYADQSQYSSYGLSSFEMPAFVAVTPILGNHPTVRGSNIRGYAAYYGGCPAAPYEATVQGWGGTINTIQFSNSGVDCGP